MWEASLENYHLRVMSLSKHLLSKLSAMIDLESVRERARNILRTYRGQSIEDFYRFVVRAILSQNTTDRNAQRAFERLEREGLLKPQNILKSPISKIAEAIEIAGMYNVRARVLRRLAFLFVKGGLENLATAIPSMGLKEARRALLSLPGIGLKTADIILLFYFNKPVMPVDTHIQRIAKRMGLVEKSARYEKIRETLEQLVGPDPEKLLVVHLALIEFGRNVCRARNPLCKECPFSSTCNYYINMFRKP